MHILNQVQVNLIYNTNCNLFLWIEIFISTTDRYNPTTDIWSCHLPNRNKQRTCFQCGSLPLLSNIKGTELPPANILIPLKRQFMRYNSAANSFYIMKLYSGLFVIYCRNCMKDDKFKYLIPIFRKLWTA